MPRSSLFLSRLERLIGEADAKKVNLLESLKAGTASETVTNIIFAELDKLEKEKKDFEQSLADERDKQIVVTEPQIRFFFQELRKSFDADMDTLKNRKSLISAMIKAVFVYDDKLTIIFLSSEQDFEINAALLDDIAENNGSLLESRWAHQAASAASQFRESLFVVRVFVFLAA